jgi:hypothetical protein
MKLLTFKLHGAEYLGALANTGIVNLGAAAPKDMAFSLIVHMRYLHQTPQH